jgi:hypothetical protein
MMDLDTFEMNLMMFEVSQEAMAKWNEGNGPHWPDE